MKTRLFSLSVAVFLLSSIAWADATIVTTDADLRAAVQVNNAVIQLGADIDLSNSTLEIKSNDTVTIDLNGFTLDRKLTQRGEGGGTVITVREGATLSISNGTLRGGWAGVGGALSNEGGNVTIYHVTCTGCTADNAGGGICNRAGTLTMTGGAITSNTSNDVKVHDDSRVGGGGFFNDIGATATLDGVTITGNKAVEYGGGGICNYGTLTLTDCTINDNTANTMGGGIWQDGTLKISGSNNITTNKDGQNKTDNVYLNPDTMLTVDGDLTGSRIGIALDMTRTFTNTYGLFNTVEPSTYFTSDVDGMTIEGDGPFGAQITSPTDGTVYYNECAWDKQNQRVVTTLKSLTPYQYTVLQSRPINPDTITYWSSGYYVCQGTINMGKIKIEEGAEVHLIFTNGSSLHVDKPVAIGYVEVRENATLFIHGQPAFENAGLFDPSSIIGTDGKEVHIEVHGGKIDTEAVNSMPAIGQRVPNDLSTFTFYDGYVRVEGDEGAPGIGSKGNGHAGVITIYGGTIHATSSREEPDIFSDFSSAGIGGGDDCTGADIYIHGGDIFASGGHEGAGIGTSQNTSSSKNFYVTITGGIVKAYGHNYGAGIGGGDDVSGATVEITGGEVYAYGGTDAAGIGGGEGGHGGKVTISGGYVYAVGNDNGAGIGGGEDGDGAVVSITGGTVIAKTSGDDDGSRAIGPGDGSDNYGKLTLGDDLMVTSERKAAASERKPMCWYRTYARIEPCDHSEVTYTVDGTTATDHHIAHCVYCNHTDTALHTFDINGICTVCGVHSETHSVILWVPKAQQDGSFDGETYHQASTHMVVPNTDFVLSMAALDVPGYRFVGWEVNTEATGSTYTSPYTTVTADTLYRVGNVYRVTDNTTFVARYQVADLVLYDNAPNGEQLSAFDGMTVNNAMLSGRMFARNIWQILTLPFDLTAEQVAASPLDGADIMQLDLSGTYDEHQTGYDVATNTLYLYFEDTTAIEAGKPYAVRFTGDNVPESPVFQHVRIANANANVSAPMLTFNGIYSPKTYTIAEPTIVCLGANNTFFQPDGTMPVTVGSLRGYVKLHKFYWLQASTEPLTVITNLEDIVTPTGIGETIVHRQSSYRKWLQNGLIFIERDGKLYNAQGARVK